MSAPIGRLRIRTSEARKRRASGSGCWQPSEAPVEAEMSDAEEAQGEGDRPRFYPFPLRVTDDGGD
jgi:hypothetical protein